MFKDSHGARFGRIALALFIGWNALGLLIFALGHATGSVDSSVYRFYWIAAGWLSFPIYIAIFVLFILWIVGKFNRSSGKSKS